MTVKAITARTWIVTSETTVGTLYQVVRNGKGELVCDCPSAYYRGGTCKHTRAVEKIARPTAATVDMRPGLALIMGKVA